MRLLSSAVVAAASSLVISPCVPPACIPSDSTARCGRHGIPWGAGQPQYHVHDLSCGNNDPNAPLFDPQHQLYHLFYQAHEPGGTVWGHVVSANLVQWAHLPVALWNDKWWDYTAVFTGSATIVDDEVVILYPGLCVSHNETLCPNTPVASSGISVNVARPANKSDPLLTTWTKNAVPAVNSTSSDPSTAWRTKSGEWRFTLEDSSVHVSTDFIHWTVAQGVSGFRPSDCPDFYELAPIINKSSAVSALLADGPTHAHKGGACVPHVGLGDFYQLGTYDEGPNGTSGVFANLTQLTCTDAFVIGDGTPGNSPSWGGGAWNCTPDPTNPTILPVSYAAKSFVDPLGNHGTGRRVEWTWINANNLPGVHSNTATAGMLGLPTELTYEPQLNKLVHVPIPELTALRTARLGGCSDGALLPANQYSEAAKDTSAALWMGLPAEAVLEQAEYYASFPVTAAMDAAGCVEFGLVFALGAGLRNVSVFFASCPATTGGSRLVQAGVDMRNTTVPCNKMLMAGRYSCRTNATFQVLARDDVLDISAYIDHTALQVFFGGGRVVLTAPWPHDSRSAAITDVGLYASGAGSVAAGSAGAWGLGSIWVSPEEVLRGRRGSK